MQLHRVLTNMQRETDRQTDRQTDRALAANVLSTVKPVGHIRRREGHSDSDGRVKYILAHYHHRGVALNVCVLSLIHI